MSWLSGTGPLSGGSEPDGDDAGGGEATEAEGDADDGSVEIVGLGDVDGVGDPSDELAAMLTPGAFANPAAISATASTRAGARRTAFMVAFPPRNRWAPVRVRAQQ